MGKTTHTVGKLVPVALKTLGDGTHADGGNLYFHVRGDSKTWVFIYTSPDTKARRKMGLGSIDSVSLAQARKHAAALRAIVKDPLNPTDPIKERNKAIDLRKLEAAKKCTFKEAAEKTIEARQVEWKSAKHGQQWITTLETYVYPLIGSFPVSSIDSALVMKVLKQGVKNKNGEFEGDFWTVRTETASRVRERIEGILNWAKASKLFEGDNPAAWKGNLENLLAKPNKIKDVEHMPYIPYQRVGDFMQHLKKKPGTSARALEFLIRTGVRSGSVRLAKWQEIDWAAKVWTIPKENTKTKDDDHQVPLTTQTLEILKTMLEIKTSDYIFPNRDGVALSDMALNKLMRTMKAEGLFEGDAVPHGFRTTGRVWAAEQTSFPDEVRRAFNMHAVGDAIKKIYERTTFLDKRALLHTQWCNFLDKPSIKAVGTDNVVPINKAAA